MNTAFLLLARYEGLAIIPAEIVCRDYFQHLDPAKFVRKVNEGEIDLPLVRIEGSARSTKGVPLVDLANYLDAEIEKAREESDRMHGRKVRRWTDTTSAGR